MRLVKGWILIRVVRKIQNSNQLYRSFKEKIERNAKLKLRKDANLDLLSSAIVHAFVFQGRINLTHIPPIRGIPGRGSIQNNRIADPAVKYMDDIFSTEEFLDFSEILAELRQNIRVRISNREKRFMLLRSLVTQFKIQGEIQFPKHWQEDFDEILRCQNKNCEDLLNICKNCPLNSETNS